MASIPLKPSRRWPAFEQVAVLQGEMVHVQNQSAQPFAKRRQRIFDVRTFGFESFALDGAVQFQFAELGGENFLADARQGAAELGVATRAIEQFAQDQHLPFAANHGQQAFDFAFHGFEIHAWALKGA